MAQYDVFGVGNALVDIQAQIEDALLGKLGIEKGIMTLVDHDQQSGVLGHLEGRPLNRCAGGSAANTIVAVADFGGSAGYVCKFGADPIGDFFVKDMTDLGVSLDVERSDLPTGTCAVLITEDAQRTMLTNLGASVSLGPDDIDPEQIAASKYVYLEGYLLTGDSSKAAAYRAIEEAKKAGVKVAFSASDPFLVNLVRDEIWELITGPVDLFFCNEEEAKSLTGETDPLKCAVRIHDHCENVALTLGGKGSIVMHGGEEFPIEGVQVDALDTTGAGDMYAGAMLYGVTNGMSWRAAGHLASHAAARIVTQLGARLHRKFTPEEIEQYSRMSEPAN
jgi:sugar/nucleoside kinase (ribokinase family)